MVELFLARHGETHENLQGILQGHLPGHLTPDGIRQAVSLRQRLASEHFDVLVASDLARSVVTARLLNEAFGLPIEFTPLLRERDWGPVTGHPAAEVRGKPLPPGVETVEEMEKRAALFLRYLLTHHDRSRVLAVGHGLFNRCILACLSHCPLSEIPRWGNAEVRRVLVDDLPAASSCLVGDDISAD